MTGDIGVNYNDLNQVTSIVFADNTVQTTASGGGTGVLLSANNLSDLSNTSTARSNLGLGTMATATATDYLDKAGNLSGLANTTTARTNLGLAYATTAQTIAGVSSTTVVTPAGAKSLRYTQNGSEIDLTPYAWQSGFTTWAGTRNRLHFPINANLSTAIGNGSWYIENQYSSLGFALALGMDWSKRVSLLGRFSLNQTSPTSNNIFRYTLGKSSANGIGDLIVMGIGVRCLYGQALEIQCHNGTTLTNFTTSFTPTFNGTVFEVEVESDGAGNCTCFVNGNQVGTTTGAPTGIAGSSTRNSTFFELVSATTNTNAPAAYGSAFKVNYGY